MKGAWLEIRLPEGDLTFPEMMSQQSLVVLCFNTSSNTNSFLSVAIVDWPKKKHRNHQPGKENSTDFAIRTCCTRDPEPESQQRQSNHLPRHTKGERKETGESFLDTVTALHGRQLRHCYATLEDLEFIYRSADGSPELPNCPLFSW